MIYQIKTSNMKAQIVVFEQGNKQVIKEGSKFFTRVFQDGENFESGDFNTLERAKESLGIAPSIENNNKVIAEFMGYKFFDGDFKVPHSNKTSNSDFKEWCTTYWDDILDSGGYLICPSNLMYHSDWNWLMEVVEKIETLGFGVDFYKGCIDVYNDQENLIRINRKGLTKMEATYNACVEFIQWHNSQTN